MKWPSFRTKRREPLRHPDIKPGVSELFPENRHVLTGYLVSMAARLETLHALLTPSREASSSGKTARTRHTAREEPEPAVVSLNLPHLVARMLCRHEKTEYGSSFRRACRTNGIPPYNVPASHQKKEGNPSFPLRTGTFPEAGQPQNRRRKKSGASIKENRFIRLDEAVFVHGHHTTFYMDRLVERAAELMSLPTDSTSLPTPPIVWQETHPRRVAILRIINLVFIILLEEFRVIRLHFPGPCSKNP